ncbi:hypothetical protein PIB30_056460 [Stylosanthes scabra]|uniref:Uncharacterized protein n=1 Tax=Stylosanthes scabra TaxID=79078 RepID=A0ABU6XHB9_9FABA|nr:hypothetical protein [Stylosanthes scabra]
MNGDSGVSFLALVHHDGEIKRRSRKGVKFKSECPNPGKIVSHIYCRVPVVVVFNGVKYDCFSIESDEDLNVLFHCRQQFPEVQITELYVETDAMGASSGESNPHPQPVQAGPSGVPYRV